MHHAHAASRRFTAGLLTGAGCLFAAACATPRHEVPDSVVDVAGMATAPAPRSTLISRADLGFSVARAHRDGAEIRVLVHQPASGVAFPVATIVASNSDAGTYISMQRLRLPPGLDPDLEVAVLEHLYVLSVEQDARASFCLAPAGPRCDAAKRGESHAQLLGQLVEQRRRALQGLPERRAAAWDMVSMVTAPTRTRDADEVAVRVSTHDRPLEAANVYFSRAPHSGCVARSNADGVASCRLVDYHGDDGDADEASAPVVATFPGDVERDRVLVPTTYVLSHEPGAGMATTR
jgi:hypothetical protein